MKIKTLVQGLTLSLALASGSAALAQVNINIMLVPPAPLHEAVPVLSPGQMWAPGYWVVNNDRHVWVRGRPMLQRTGYLWQPDRWAQRSNGSYYRQVGHWTRDTHARPIKAHNMQQPEHDNGRRHEGKKDKKDKGHDNGGHNGRGNGH